MPLRHISVEVQYIGEGSSFSFPCPLDVCLLCEDMFTTIESTVTGKTTLYNEIPTDSVVVFVFAPASLSIPLLWSEASSKYLI